MFRTFATKILHRVARRDENSWDMPVDTMRQRTDALDRAILNVHICTRRERDEASATASDTLLGDYAEFGVYRGETFAHVVRRSSPLMPSMRFFAFDSFQGLPEPTGADKNGEFWKGQFSCSRQDFERTLSRAEANSSRVRVVEGWFQDSLCGQTAVQHSLNTVSLAFIDCDLYESCVPVLDFLTDKLRQGSVLLFDDWLNFRGCPDRGVQLATRQWLEQNPRLFLHPWFSFCHHGQAFIVNDSQYRYEHG
jgi:O-methyltransferase